MIYAAPSDPSDAFELQLREEDAKEVSEGWRHGVALAILDGGCVSYRSPEGLLLGIFGMAQVGEEFGIWLLCSGHAARFKASVWRTAKRMVAQARTSANGRLIYNFIPKYSTSNREFVSALGFRILPSPRDGFDFFYLPQV